MPLHFRERGADDGTGRAALVFLHYFGGSGRSWEPVMEIMARRGFRCIAPDLRGFGESSNSSTDPSSYTVKGMADDVHELVRRLGLKRFVVVGHSMGGKVALSMAAQRPAGLASVALIAPSPPTPEPMSSAERARLLASCGNAAMIEETLRKITARPLPSALFDLALADTLRASAPAWRAWLEHGSREDITEQLAAVWVPASIAIGAADKNITADLVEREIVARLDRVTVVEQIAESGHLVPLEAPEATSGFIERVLA